MQVCLYAQEHDGNLLRVFIDAVDKHARLHATADFVCRGPSPLWAEFAKENPRMSAVASLLGDWLHVNCYIFGHCGELT